MDNLRAQFQETWGQLAPWQRFAGVAILVSGVAMALLFSLWMKEPSYALLYQGLNEQDAAAIVKELESAGIPYQLVAGGTAIEVPAKDVANVRLKLAAQNLPKGGVVGFELFDQSGLSGIGMTERMQKVNFQRALEGELSRTIMALDTVEVARVHIVLPEESLFADQQEDPKASVMFKPASGARLSNSQVQAIRYLVANSVEGLEPSNVSIVDTEGNVYESPEASAEMSVMAATGNQLQIQRSYEVESQSKIQAMLDRALGPQKAVVRVNVEMNWDREESTLETVAPAGEVGSVVRSTQQKQESWKGAPASAAEGVPGVDANAPADDVPNYQAGDAAGGVGEYSNQESVVNYEVSKEIKNIQRQPGRVERVSVAVLVDESLAEEEVDKVKALVKAAVGFNEERGDQVTVQRIAFNDVLLTQEAAALEEMAQRDFYIRIGTIVALLLGLGAILFFAWKLFSDMQKRMLPYVIEPDVPALPDGQQATASLQQAASNAYGQASEPPPALSEEELEEWLKLPSPDEGEMRLRAVARRNPELIATILKDWVKQKPKKAPVTG